MVAAGLCLALMGCGGGGADSPASAQNNTTGLEVSSAALLASVTALPIETLSTAEVESLAFMREEEKLAHDVYAQLGTLWGQRVFTNIANSEAAHTDWVRELLLRYQQPDPTAALAAGVYDNATLQGLYNQLLAAGAVSLVDALKVGAAIEEIDMIDINKALLNVDNQDIRLVYDNLLKGSRNHLRSFVSNLSALGVTYQPQYMVQVDYQAIVSTPMER